MYRIYHDKIAAIVADEDRKLFCYTSIEKAKQVAKSIESKTSYRTALNQREEFLLEVGYKKEKFIG
ncbi:hypothetical protein ACTXNW_02165 [Enterococcus malodoratus]|jgi:hypothetical protein|uniref:hypothetical protein n=1 Tax=Enterococcus malodoratus TaxID=71451 RepID=UPI002049C389|nr:MAG TPA: hypothetical protein [Caudoviricetes sp.]